MTRPQGGARIKQYKSSEASESNQSPQGGRKLRTSDDTKINISPKEQRKLPLGFFCFKMLKIIINKSIMSWLERTKRTELAIFELIKSVDALLSPMGFGHDIITVTPEWFAKTTN